ncbi:conjugal transfer protein [Salmonella enterica subsp. diarizonae]|uniref:Type IV secretion system protein n=1 Tax=Salmonella enterica TaxID=28901 RepID=A0A754B3F3_SALER|nr:type IV secretion system protein [Salmonella enterica]ECC9721939.1 conjugal transfer protein [Salmonella enterica subsp. diarizonae]ECU9164191.1 type IV secretion system protein [Salmonella enterica subsp. enterica serovar Newport str. CFSAN000599]EDU1197045.1 type IV secretion system protein [Salmonella enterica subsp. enterica serovar Heidelberg str. CFSAN000576]HAF8581215.1 type IV secretion system protein [Salmonella enterica]
MSGGILVGFERNIIGGFHAILDGAASTYGIWMAGIFTSCLTAYISWRGYQTLAGKLQRPVEDVVWDVAKMLIIMMFVTNAGGYLDMTAAAINGIRDGVSGDQSIWALLDTVWERSQTLGQGLYNMDGSTYVPVNGAIAEFIVWLSVAFLVGVSAFINLIAELILMLMLTTAPIFIFCLMWNWLRPTFNNWLQSIISCILTTLFSGLALQVIMRYINSLIDYAASVKVTNMITLAFQVGIAAILAGLIIFVIYKLSCMLAGVAAQGAIQGMAMAGLSNGLSIAKNTASSIGNGLAKIGERATENIKSSPIIGNQTTYQSHAAAAREASIQTVLRNKSQRGR